MSLFKGNGPKVSCMVSFAVVKEDSHNNPCLWFSNEKKQVESWKRLIQHSKEDLISFSIDLRGNMVKYNKKDFY